MTDYKDEQTNELEALESIYSDDLTLLSTEPHPCFQMAISTNITDDEMENASCVLQFTYTSKYPDEAPLFEVVSTDNLEAEHADTLVDFIKAEVEENLGMVMVFTLVSAVQEKLNQIVEQEAEQKVLEAERLLREKEEAEQRRFDGIRVTIESFLAWKTKFDAEIAESRRQQGKTTKAEKKLSGRELFMQDHTLDDSDVKFLEEEGDTVQVDESLFADLDDLELDDDEMDAACS